ncbi:uncharacterized protein ATNIH1004_007003 [Aspergillus tanneri]|uniref:V-type proton ATPase subunit G n=1 Tax=Aspergillus tanneri TaxID=1220188 RepID=A0A5M9MJJ9_9EURO|nr:uncharacterized protein ATNIH1004_007003 [Aspergillus tanneri]KAA8645584.1 hypothetical protein ATNIH1004_007003 [Aspergillus tanneri]
MSAQNSAGIQTLLDAEREAQKIVQQARECMEFSLVRNINRSYFDSDDLDRTKRVRDAKSEAQKEIEEYRNQKEAEFRKFEAEHSSGYKKAEDDANKEADVRLQEIKESADSKGGKVIDDLIHALVEVNPQPSEKILAKA